MLCLQNFWNICILINKAIWTIWRAPFLLTPSAFGPELVYRLRVGQPALMDVPRHMYFWYNIIILYLFVYHILMTSPLWLAVCPQSL